jgi:hypothetical protein
MSWSLLLDRREHLVRDLPVAGRVSVLVWWKRIWRYPNPNCLRRSRYKIAFC